MSKKRFKQYLMLLTVVGLVAVAAGGSGTFASFSAETTNANNQFATGDLLLSNTVNAQTACLSDATFNANPTNNNTQSDCDFVAQVTAQHPGSAITTATVTVQNTGSIDASHLYLSAPGACSDTQLTDLTFNPAAGYPLCGATLMYVQETSQSGVGEAGEGAYTYCWYGNGAGTSTCTTNTATLNSDTTDTLTNFTTVLGASPGVRLYPLSASGTDDTGNTIPDLKSSATRVFTVGLYLPNTVANQNQLMDLESQFGLTWHIDQ